MRYLNKIILINSATIRYEEILLDGNVHLIGTQGVGKSTVLRAILFFYNGDTQKLGISREKKLFAEYYFPFADSYIVYEVQRETGPFSIILMRSGTGVQFRFVDAAYEPDWIIKDQKALERWGDIRQGLDQRGIDSSNRIDRLQEYRDIIYGNAGVKPAYRKYSLLESKQYQNIPRTITNVFLNTRLEASLIKETIIHSLSEEELAIDLVKYRHHLRDFEREFEDIQKFKKPRAQEQAEIVIEAFNNITRTRTGLMHTAAMLGSSLELAESEKEQLKVKLSKQEQEKQELQEKFEKREKREQDQITLIGRDIKVLEDSIRKANKKEREYKEQGIVEILERSGRKQEWENQLGRLAEERQALVTKFDSIEQKFEVRLKQMKNSLEQLRNERQKDENDRHQQFQEQKDKLNRQREEELEEVRKAFEKIRDEIDQKDRETREERTKLREERSKLQEREWRGEEIHELREAMQQAVAASKEAEREQSFHDEKIRQLKKDWEREDEKMSDKTQNRKTELRAQLAKNDEDLTVVRSKLDKYKDTFYGYLQENYPDWHESIGKVAREDLLFSENLEPELKEEAIRLFYGFKLNLDEVKVSAKSLEQYELEKKKLEEQEQTLKKGLADLDSQHQKNLDRLKKRFQPKIREQKDKIHKLSFEQTQQQQLEKKKSLELEELQQKAKEEKQQALDQLNTQIAQLDAELGGLAKTLMKQKEHFESTQKKINEEHSKRFKQQQEKLGEQQKKIAEKFKLRAREVEKRIKALNKQKSEELKGAGADTERIAQLDEEIQAVRAELKFITDNQELLFGYKKDKEELFDKVEAFKKDRTKKEEKQKLAKERLTDLKKSHDTKIKESDSAISEIKKRQSNIDEGLKEVEKFNQTELYSQIQAWLSDEATEKATAYQLRELIDTLRDVSISLNKYQEDMRDAANRFLNNFSEANLFQFRTALSTLSDYLAFAADLREFIDENKIVEYESRVKARFANIIGLVSKETGDLISREGEIQKVISKVNGDFRARNFVGVIQSMELKIDDSDNRVMRTLKRIRDYEQERGFELGEQNLFNAAITEDHNQRAVEFLRQLSRDISEVKQEQVKLSDAFELRFRVVENDNDSGWVEKLSNVGSEGTDVLVKAMINILLLNVFKESASRKFKDFRLHCMMDEIGRLHPTNVRGILKFANDRNILLINGSPVEQDAMAYRHIYELRKDKESHTRVKRLISVNQSSPALS